MFQHRQAQGRHVGIDVDRLHPGLAHHGHHGQARVLPVIQVKVVTFHHLHDGALLPVLVDHPVVGLVPCENLPQALEHPLIAPGVGGQKGDHHRVFRDLVQQIENVLAGVSLKTDPLLPLLEFLPRGPVEPRKFWQVMVPMPGLERLIRLFVFQGLQEHQDRGRLPFQVSQKASSHRKSSSWISRKSWPDR